MIKAVIVEDDKNNIEVLSGLLERYCPQVNLLGSAMRVPEAIGLITARQPDLLFLDVELGDQTGFDVIRSFKTPAFRVIFTTAHEQYAFRAIKSSCIEYLLKPVNYTELQDAVRKFEEQKNSSLNQKKIELLLHNLDAGPSFNKLAIPTPDGYSFLDAGEILYCQADLNYTVVHTSRNERLMSSKNLKEFEDLLNPGMFFRCHKSFIINLNYIKKYNRGNSVVIMSDETPIDIAVRKKEEFLKRFGRL
jgi:two-component system, LytTR family, response regulator